MGFHHIKLKCSLSLNFFHLLAQKPNLEHFLFIQTNSLIIFTCPYPVLLVPGLWECKDWNFRFLIQNWQAYMPRFNYKSKNE